MRCLTTLAVIPWSALAVLAVPGLAETLSSRSIDVASSRRRNRARWLLGRLGVSGGNVLAIHKRKLGDDFSGGGGDRDDGVDDGFGGGDGDSWEKDSPTAAVPGDIGILPQIVSGTDIPSAAPSQGSPSSTPSIGTLPLSTSHPTYIVPIKNTAEPTVGWEPLPPPVEPPTYNHAPSPTTTDYAPPDDDPIHNVHDDKIQDQWKDKPYMDIAKDEYHKILNDRDAAIVAAVVGLVGLILIVVTAQQMIENPDGCFAKLCRCIVAVFRILCWPCRKMCCSCGGSRARDRRTHQVLGDGDGFGGYGGYSHDLELT